MFAYEKQEHKKAGKNEVQKKKTDKWSMLPNITGIPANRKAGYGSLSGFSFNAMQVNHNLGNPAQLQALAYRQDNQVRKNDAGHKWSPIVQQKQGSGSHTEKKQGAAIKDVSSLEREPEKFSSMEQLKEREIQQHTQRVKSPEPVIQLRSDNPFKHGNSITSHHIIPYELITSLQSKLDEPSKKRVAAAALPDFGKMNIEKLMVGAIQVRKDDNILKKEDLVDELSFAFDEMSEDTRNKLTFNLEGPIYNYQVFSAQYELYRSNPSSLSDFDLDELGQCFFEWQGGNLFQGPKRAEAMPSNAFDVDAHYFYDQEYEDRLQVLYNQLKAEDKPESDQGRIISLLGQMTEITRNISPPEYNPEKYIKIKNNIHLDLLKDYVKDGRKSHMAVGSSVPVEETVEFVEKYTGNEAYDSWVDYYTSCIERSEDGIMTPFEFIKLRVKVERRFREIPPKIIITFDDEDIEIFEKDILDRSSGFLNKLEEYIQGLNQHPQ